MLFAALTKANGQKVRLLLAQIPIENQTLTPNPYSRTPNSGAAKATEHPVSSGLVRDRKADQTFESRGSHMGIFEWFSFTLSITPGIWKCAEKQKRFFRGVKASEAIQWAHKTRAHLYIFLWCIGCPSHLAVKRQNLATEMRTVSRINRHFCNKALIY